MVDWEDLVRRLQLRWNVSREDVCNQLFHNSIRYAIFVPLIGVNEGLSFLNKPTNPHQVQNWAKECHRIGSNWKDRYLKISEHCLEISEDKEKACLCLLNEIEFLFDGIDKIEQGTSILRLVENGEVEIGNILLQQLSEIRRIQTKCHAQDLSWLMESIDNLSVGEG